MKKSVFLFATLISLSASAERGPCIAIYHSDASYIKAALGTLEPTARINKIGFERRTATEADITIELVNDRVTLTVEQKCETGKLSVQGKPSEEFVCQRGWINCMPRIGAAPNKYCSNEYSEWAAKHCSGTPEIAQ